MLIYVGGAKGGVGKSLVSMAAIDYIYNLSKNPVLIETDNNNPDVFKSYDKKIESYAYNIDTEKGWVNTLDTIYDISKRSQEQDIIINSAARNTETMMNYGSVLNELPVEVVTLWVINNQRDSIILLNEYIDIVNQKICVVKNGFFGSDHDFQLFSNSKLSKNNIQSVYLNKATESIIKSIYTERKAIHELNDVLSFGERLLANSWIHNSRQTIEKAITIASVYKK